MRERQFKLFNDLFLFSMKTKEYKIFADWLLRYGSRAQIIAVLVWLGLLRHFSHTFSAVLTMPKSAPNDLLISTGREYLSADRKILEIALEYSISCVGGYHFREPPKCSGFTADVNKP